MDIQEVRLLIKQIGKELYEDNPERQARGPFSVDKYDGPMTREQKLADVEAYQTEMLEKQAYRDALMDLEDSLVEASPSVGEKLITNFINFYPMGRRSNAGIGSLMGKEIGEMSEAEALRIKDIEQELYELNSVYQKEGRGIKEMDALKKEKQGIMSMLGKTPLSPKTEARKGRKKIDGKWFTREQWERLSDEEIDLMEKGADWDEEPFAVELEEDFGYETEEDLMKVLIEKPFSSMSEGLRQQVEDYLKKNPNSVESIKLREILKIKGLQAGGYVEAPSSGVDAKEIAKRLNQVIFEKEYNPDISIAQNFEKIVDAARNKGEYKSKDFDPLGISSATQLKRYSVSDEDKPKLKAILGNTSLEDVASQYDAPLIGEYDVKQHLLNFLIEKQGSYKAGGYVMNLGDYGRSYK